MVYVKEKESRVSDDERLGEFLSSLADQSFRESEELDTEIAQLPDPLKRRVRSFETRLQQLTGLEARDRQDLLDQYTRAVEGAYIESMTELPNRRFAHEHMTALYDNIVRAARRGESDQALQSARQRAFIAFDLDGLKVVNDLATPASGDRYIKLFAKVIEEVGKELKEEQGMQIVAARDGGDEFSLIIDWPGHTIDLAEISKIVELVSERFQASDTHTIINLENTKSELQKKGLTLEEGFTFRSSVSGGGISLYDALRVHTGAKTVEGGYRATLASLAGFTRDLGEITAKKVKARRRQEMHKGTPNEQFLAKLFDQFRPIEGEEDERGAAFEQRIREHEKTIERLETIIAALEHEVATLKAEKKDREDTIEERDRKINEQALFIAELQSQLALYGKKKRAAG